MDEWICGECGNTEMEHLYCTSEWNGNKDTDWRCDKCEKDDNVSLFGEIGEEQVSEDKEGDSVSGEEALDIG